MWLEIKSQKKESYLWCTGAHGQVHSMGCDWLLVCEWRHFYIHTSCNLVLGYSLLYFCQPAGILTAISIIVIILHSRGSLRKSMNPPYLSGYVLNCIAAILLVMANANQTMKMKVHCVFTEREPDFVWHVEWWYKKRNDLRQFDMYWV